MNNILLLVNCFRMLITLEPLFVLLSFDFFSFFSRLICAQEELRKCKTENAQVYVLLD